MKTIFERFNNRTQKLHYRIVKTLRICVPKMPTITKKLQKNNWRISCNSPFNTQLTQGEAALAGGEAGQPLLRLVHALLQAGGQGSSQGQQGRPIGR